MDSKKEAQEAVSVSGGDMPLFRHDLGTEADYDAVVASVEIIDMGGGDSSEAIDTTCQNAKPPTFWQRWWSPIVYICYLWVRL